MSLFGITADYNGPLEAGHASTDDDKCEFVERSTARWPTLDLSDQLRECSIAFTNTSRLSSANELVWHHRRL